MKVFEILYIITEFRSLKLKKFLNALFFSEVKKTSKTVECNVRSEEALEKGSFLGEFFNMINEFGIGIKHNRVSKTHNMSRLYNEFVLSIEKTSEKNILKAKDCITKIAELQEEMHVIEYLRDNKRLPIRVTYSETKISEISLKHINNPYEEVDQNRIMPDIIHYDFGDMVRITCCSVTEDEKDLDKVSFDINLYKAYKKGFLSQVENTLIPLEIEMLDLSVKTMIFTMGLRFLTDYFNGNICYDVLYKNQNFDRAKNQFKLLDSYIKQREESVSCGKEGKVTNHYKDISLLEKLALEEFLSETKTDCKTIVFN